MSDFAVIADLPLGAYRARTPGGHLDPMPSPARLHAALMCAAAAGPRAQVVGQDLEPSDDDLTALLWLEVNPPDGVLVPATAKVPTGVYAYRREGTLRKEGSAPGPSDKVVKRPLVGLVAVGGAFAWTWCEDPPEGVRSCLEGLCADVAHLGSADTPVRLRVGKATPTHRRKRDASLFDSAPGLDTEVAATGRTVALGNAYRAERPAPSKAKDRFATSELPRSAAFVAAGRDRARFVPVVDDDTTIAPWGTVLLAGFGAAKDEPGPETCVGWATAVHRALISLVGDGAPPVLTGAYLPGEPRHANRVAIQLIPTTAALTAGLDHDGCVLAVLLPIGAASEDLALVSEAMAQLPHVTWGRRKRRLQPLGARSARRFWPAAARGQMFDTWPAAVPDTRPIGAGWTIADAVAVSVGFVLRDQEQLFGDGRGDARHRGTARRVKDAGLQVHSVTRVMDGDLSRYVHKIDSTRIVQPYRARLSWGGLLDDRSLIAIGQSRHLGGGLLLPVKAAS